MNHYLSNTIFTITMLTGLSQKRIIRLGKRLPWGRSPGSRAEKRENQGLLSGVFSM